jgi:3-hydroxyisobutyrate dehydrogenase
VQDTYRDALARYGPVDGELLAVAALEERAGIRLAAGAARGDARGGSPAA